MTSVAPTAVTAAVSIPIAGVMPSAAAASARVAPDFGAQGRVPDDNDRKSTEKQETGHLEFSLLCCAASMIRTERLA
jgi:hypothetical protein